MKATIKINEYANNKKATVSADGRSVILALKRKSDYKCYLFGPFLEGAKKTKSITDLEPNPCWVKRGDVEKCTHIFTVKDIKTLKSVATTIVNNTPASALAKKTAAKKKPTAPKKNKGKITPPKMSPEVAKKIAESKAPATPKTPAKPEPVVA